MSNTYRPKVTGKSWLYGFCWYWFRPFLWNFFKRRQIVGIENIPLGKPIFLIPNHQNAFLDSIHIAPWYPSGQFTFLLRAAMFKNKKLSRLFYSLNMLPIYRQLDGSDEMNKNDEVYMNCVWLLEHNRTIVCHAEGGHSLTRRLRPLKKGVFRFAFGAEEKNNWELDVYIIPVGLNYTDMQRFGSNSLAIYGKAIPLSKFKELFKANPARALNDLKREVESAMSPLMIDIRNEKYYTLIESCREVAINHYRVGANMKSTLLQEFDYGRRVTNSLEQKFEKNETLAENLKEKISEYNAERKKLKLNDSIFDADYKFMNVGLAILEFTIGLPVFCVGFAMNGFPFVIPVLIANKVVKDPAFRASILWAAGLFCFTIYYSVIFFAALFMIAWWAAPVAIIIAIISGLFAVFYARKFKKFIVEWRVKKTVNAKKVKHLKQLRVNILNEILDFN